MPTLTTPPSPDRFCLQTRPRTNARRVQLYQLDIAQSVIGTVLTPATYHYPPYGGVNVYPEMLMISFVGQRFDGVSGGYPLGNGLRLYKPELLRFTSPDGLSPFGKGGRNSYAYCEGDPLNRHDPSGQFWVPVLRAAARLTRAITRHLLGFDETTLRTVRHVFSETVSDARRQLTPAYEAVRVVLVAAATVPSPQSMRIQAHLGQQSPSNPGLVRPAPQEGAIVLRRMP